MSITALDRPGEEHSETSRLRVFWIPGCSSCMRVKEFLTDLKVPFESVNALEDPRAADDLASLGAMSVPVVVRGKDFVFAQSLDDVAAFLGLDVKFDRLAPEILMDLWLSLLDTTLSLLGDFPDEQLAHRPVATRDRTMRDIAYHIFQIPEALLLNQEKGVTDFPTLWLAPVPQDVRTTADIGALAAGSRNVCAAGGTISKTGNWAG